MRKKYLSALLFGALLFASAGTFTSCKDYDDDINNLQTQITANADAIKALQTKIDAGNWVTDVTAIENGFKITFNDGQSYEIVNGKDGQNGKDGKDGSEWTIGEDGFWYKDGEKTGYEAAIKDSETVLPTIKDGYWWLVNADGELEATDYKANGAAYAIDTDGVYTIIMPSQNGEDTIEIKLPKYNLTSIAFATDNPEVTYNYAIATKDFKDKITGIEYKQGEIIPLISNKNKSGIDVPVVVNPIDADLTACPFKLMASDNSTIFATGEAREYDGELLTRTATSGLKYVNFKFTKGLKETDKAFSDWNQSSALAVVAGGVSTNYLLKVKTNETKSNAYAVYTTVKLGKTYSIFGEDDSKLAGDSKNYQIIGGNAVSYKLIIDKDYCEAYNITIDGTNFTIGKYSASPIPYTLQYTTEDGELKESKGGFYTIKDIIAEIELTASHTLNTTKQDVVFSLDNFYNAMTAEQRIEWKNANINAPTVTFKSSTKDEAGNAKYTFSQELQFVKQDATGKWVTAEAKEATGLKAVINPADNKIIADTYVVDAMEIYFNGNKITTEFTLKLSNPQTLTRISSLFDGDNVVAYGNGNNGLGEIFNVLSLYEQKGATFYADGATLKVEKGDGMSNTDGWNANGTQLTIGKDNMYKQTAKVTITVPVFEGNTNNLFKDVIYVTAKSPIKEGSIEALKTTLELGQSKTAKFTNADFKAADVWGTIYKLFGTYTTTGTGDDAVTVFNKPSSNISKIEVVSSTSLIKVGYVYNSSTSTYEQMVGFTLTVDNEAALQSGDKVKVTIKITDKWGIETTKEVELTVVK